jgi:hypothetical protein
VHRLAVPTTGASEQCLVRYSEERYGVELAKAVALGGQLVLVAFLGEPYVARGITEQGTKLLLRRLGRRRPSGRLREPPRSTKWLILPN